MAPSLELGNTQKVLDDQRKEGEHEEHFSYAIQLATSSVLSLSLQSAIEPGVFHLIARAGEGAKLLSAEIAAQLPTTNVAAPFMLDPSSGCWQAILCSDAVGDGNTGSNFHKLYRLAPMSKYFASNEDGVSFRPPSWHWYKTRSSWKLLKNAVLDGGIPFNKAHGMHAFECPGLDLRFNHVFNTAMYNHTTIVIKNILKFCKGFEDLKQLVDVAGGLGVTLNLITSKYLHIKGGDMFGIVPNGDDIFMKWILHDWTDEHCLKLLKNCYKAIPDNGKVTVVEAILPVMSDTSSAVKSTFQFEVGMMTQNPGGQERSQEKFLAFSIGAGFSGIRFECFVSNFCVVESFK